MSLLFLMFVVVIFVVVVVSFFHHNNISIAHFYDITVYLYFGIITLVILCTSLIFVTTWPFVASFLPYKYFRSKFCL